MRPPLVSVIVLAGIVVWAAVSAFRVADRVGSLSEPHRWPPGVERGPAVGCVGPHEATILLRTIEAAPCSVELSGPDGRPRRRLRAASVDDHHFVFDGLEPATSYTYRVFVDGRVVGEHAFRTAPADPRARVHFDVLGDSGWPTVDAAAIAARLDTDDPDLILWTGDVAYKSGTDDEVRNHFYGTFAHVIDHVPFWVAFGDHDGVGDPDARRRLLIPRVEDRRPGWFAFRRGGVFFLVLNTMRPKEPGSRQWEFVQRQLASRPCRDADWRVVLLHHPPYGVASSKTAAKELRDTVCELFDANQVDLVFSGDEHLYARSKPIRGGAPVRHAFAESHDDGGVVYVVTGGGGRRLDPAEPRPHLVRAESVHHFVRVVAWRGSLRLSAIRADGTLLDRFTLERRERPD